MITRRAVATVLLVALAEPGCVEYTRELRITDPARVTIRTETASILPAESARLENPRRATLREDAFETEPGATSRYELTAVRQPSGEIAFEWTTKVPLINGEIGRAHV